jgi:hypothetical protein
VLLSPGSASPIDSQKSSASALNAPDSAITAAPPCGRDGTHAQQLGNVYQLFDGVDNHDTGIFHLGAHDFVVIDHGAGMSGRRFARGTAAARVKQHDVLTKLLWPGEPISKLLRLPELLDQQNQHARPLILDQILDEVFRAVGRFVAG